MDRHPGLDFYLSANYLHHIKDAHHRSAGARLLMESSPLQMLLVARMEEKRPKQVTLGLLALPLTCQGSSQVTRSGLTSKRVGRCNPTMCHRWGDAILLCAKRKREALNVLMTFPGPLYEPRGNGFQI